MREETLESISSGELSDERLQGYVDRYLKKESEYKERIKRGAEDSQTEEEYINEMEGLNEMLDEAAVYA